MSNLKIISWNVNGIRSVLKKSFLDFVAEQNPDMLCLQETRAKPSQVALSLPGYHLEWNWCEENSGYSGTAIFTKTKPLGISRGLAIPKHDKEGRVITAEYNPFFLVSVYVPNAKEDLSRLPYRANEWDVEFLAYLKNLEKKKPVIFAGDLNVAHREIDLANPDRNKGNHGFTEEERKGFDHFVAGGFLDTFRELHTEGGHYTWWRQTHQCRLRNIGWRIDYILISKSLRPRLEDAFILPHVMGSDHCPVGIRIKFD